MGDEGGKREKERGEREGGREGGRERQTERDRETKRVNVFVHTVLSFGTEGSLSSTSTIYRIIIRLRVANY